MINISAYIEGFNSSFLKQSNINPWTLVRDLAPILQTFLDDAGENYYVENGIAKHKTAIIESGATIKGPAIIGENCFIGAHAYFRGPVFLDRDVKIGPGCEIKQSIIFSNTAIAHFNYIGDSIIGSHVNFEAGSIAANHYNERTEKFISVLYEGEIIPTNVTKFGSLVGDHSKIGANAVLSPGTLLPKHSVVNRLQLIEQLPG